jgi:hypothetical protein
MVATSGHKINKEGGIEIDIGKIDDAALAFCT